jgi:hypothetical protein
MSRDKHGNRTQEIDGSSPFSFTNSYGHPSFWQPVRGRVSPRCSLTGRSLPESGDVAATRRYSLLALTTK